MRLLRLIRLCGHGGFELSWSVSMGVFFFYLLFVMAIDREVRKRGDDGQEGMASCEFTIRASVL